MRVDGRWIRIVRLAADGYEFIDEPELAIDALRQSGIRADIFTFTQRFPDTQPKYDYPMEVDNVAALPISTFDHWWTKQINDKTRNMVRRANKKGVLAREIPFDDATVRGISAIYNESPIRQGKPFPHFGKSLDAVRHENATFLDRSVFIGVFAGQTLIGIAKLVIDERRAHAALMQILSMIQHRDKAPTNALLAEAVRSCAARGIPYLLYAKFAYGNKQRDSLSDFKHHNGFRQITVPRYYVAFSRLGAIALRYGLHRQLTECLPETLLAHLRHLRHLALRLHLYSTQPASLRRGQDHATPAQ
jgi:hypothetical protein